MITMWCLVNWGKLHTAHVSELPTLKWDTALVCAGSAVVDWLVFTQLVLTRVEALTLASALLEEGFLRTVGLKSAEALRSGGLHEQFLDDSTALYSFVGSRSSTFSQDLFVQKKLMRMLHCSLTVRRRGAAWRPRRLCQLWSWAVKWWKEATCLNRWTVGTVDGWNNGWINEVWINKSVGLQICDNR